MKKIMTALTAITLCAGVAVASYAESAQQYQPAPTKVAATQTQASNPCEKSKEASLQTCKNERCKQHAENSYKKCTVAFAKHHPQMNAQPQTQQQ